MTKREKDAARQRARRASFSETQCVTCGKCRMDGSRYCATCYARYEGYKVRNRKGRPSIVTCRTCGTQRSTRTRCAQCAKAVQKRIRSSGQKKRYSYSPDGRMTFCQKCLSEKEVHKGCESCRKSYSISYRAKNTDKRRAYKKAFWAENKERLSQDNKRHYWEHREQRLEQNRLYHKREKEACRIRQGRRRAKLLGAAGSHTAAEWQAILKKHRGRCADCGEGGKLTKDHVVPLSQGGTNFAYNMQPLCLSCNSRKQAKILDGVHFSLFDKVLP